MEGQGKLRQAACWKKKEMFRVVLQDLLCGNVKVKPPYRQGEGLKFASQIVGAYMWTSKEYSNKNCDLSEEVCSVIFFSMRIMGSFMEDMCDKVTKLI